LSRLKKSAFVGWGSGRRPAGAVNLQSERRRRYARNLAEDDRHVLVVAYRTAAAPRLPDAVRRRARVGRCKLTLLVPTPYWDRYTVEAELVIELAVPLLEEAVGRPVEAVIGHPEPVDAVRELVMRSPVNEVIVSTLPERVSRWLRRGILSRLRALGCR
jgi:hypothetical protein